MVEELPKPVEADLQCNEEDSLEESKGTEESIENEERTDNEEEKGMSLTDGKSVEIVQTQKKRTRKRTNHDEGEGIKLRRERDRVRQRLARQNEDEEKRRIRLEKDRIRKRTSRQNEDEFERLKRRDKDRERRARKREMERRKREEAKNENGGDTKVEIVDSDTEPSVEIKKENQKTVDKIAHESNQVVKNNFPRNIREEDNHSSQNTKIVAIEVVADNLKDHISKETGNIVGNLNVQPNQAADIKEKISNTHE